MRFRVSEQEEGQRADRLVQRHVGLPRRDVERLFAHGQVWLNGRAVPKGARATAGDEVRLAAEAVTSAAAVADPAVPVRVVYEDAALLVVDKPPGMATHPLRAGERGCLANGLVARFAELAGVGYEPRQPGLVNRLDNDTSGLVVVARSAASFEELRQRLEAGELHKRYTAICDRAPDRPRMDWALAQDPRDRRRVRWRESGATPADQEFVWKPAETHVFRTEPRAGSVLVEVAAPRARRHQVRCHLAAAGAPIVGDVLYGGRALPVGRHMLHACYVSLPSPATGQRVEVRSEPPGEWDAWLKTE